VPVAVASVETVVGVSSGFGSTATDAEVAGDDDALSFPPDDDAIAHTPSTSTNAPATPTPARISLFLEAAAPNGDAISSVSVSPSVLGVGDAGLAGIGRGARSLEIFASTPAAGGAVAGFTGPVSVGIGSSTGGRGITGGGETMVWSAKRGEGSAGATTGAGASNTLVFGRSSRTSATIPPPCSAATSVAERVPAPVKGASSSSHDGRNAAARRSASSGVRPPEGAPGAFGSDEAIE
jgi:hypothetical protein